ncbi:hypothetical protein [Actinoallomurus iriomotensis]|uniref:Uncharacterized protein n=1 Tax=Actinoallomurus iriomotensis TaxID=478107 RepID=A0A9W6S813_9ACTN|nr:hypothetical protein [Actinoallomurus iriomotensis]GLY87452.1 hypothetical protein Airi02_053810 [Actinoallomurus iriomotensis]
MRLVVGSAFVIQQPFESFPGPGRAKEDLKLAPAVGLTAGNRGVHDLDRQILPISACQPLAYDGARPWRPGVQPDTRQLSDATVRPTGGKDHDRAVREAAMSRDVRDDVRGHATGRDFGEKFEGV